MPKVNPQVNPPVAPSNPSPRLSSLQGSNPPSPPGCLGGWGQRRGVDGAAAGGPPGVPRGRDPGPHPCQARPRGRPGAGKRERGRGWVSALPPVDSWCHGSSARKGGQFLDRYNPTPQVRPRFVRVRVVCFSFIQVLDRMLGSI